MKGGVKILLCILSKKEERFLYVKNYAKIDRTFNADMQNL